MTNYNLVPTQKAAVFELVKGEGIDPAGFKWDTEASGWSFPQPNMLISEPAFPWSADSY